MIGEVIFRGVTARHWEHSFLEFYRCVERLYTAYNAKILKLYINSVINCESFTQSIQSEDIISKVEDSSKIVDVIKNHISDNFNILSIENFIEKKWIYKEQDILFKLMCEVEDNPLIQRFAKVLDIDSDKIEKDDKGIPKYKNLCNIVAGKIYPIRNSIAHFRPYDNKDNNIKWDELINIMCDFIDKLYVIYSEVIDSHNSNI